jgi:LytS/YehU family sensor histidine kinase
LHTDDRTLTFHITNTRQKKKEGHAVNGGIGLENIRQRLALLYPNKHKLEIREENDKFDVHLMIVLRNE